MKNTNQILDEALYDIRHDEPTAPTVQQAAERVWARVANEENLTAVTNTAQAEHLRDCNDFQSLIPAYLSKQLSAARVLLFEDHTRECFACRKALKSARTENFAPATAAATAPKKSWFSLQQPAFKFAMAAVFVLGVGFGSWRIFEYVMNAMKAFDAVMMASNGAVYRIADTQNELLPMNAIIKRGEKIRTAKGANAVVKLPDGSLIEMAERSEFALTDSPAGTTINLHHGNVIVQAAKQRNKHLYVKTDDALVSVVGTIFSVNNGTKGSRVSVVEGEVHVDHNNKNDVLHPGDQTTTNASIERVAIKQEIAWSRDANRYDELLDEVAKLRQDIQALPRPGVRYSTHVLDVMPDNTVFYAALPNLTETLSASYNLIKERVAANPELDAWMNKQPAQDRPFGFADKAFSQLREFGTQLGDEITMSFGLNAKGSPDEPLFVATVRDAGALRAAIEQLNHKQVQIVDDPAQATAQAGADFFVWLRGDTLAASPNLVNLQKFAVSLNSESRFKTTSFYASIAKRYNEGTSVIVAADLDKIVPQMGSNQKENAASEQLGLTNFKHFIAEIKDGNGKAQNSAELTFKEANKGIASWLAAPAPMGALNFISADASVVGAFVVKDPRAMADNLINALKTAEPKFGEELAQFESEHGLNIRQDIAAPLGGEFAFALDGPVIPTPAWKIIVEVYDQARLQQTLEQFVVEINRAAEKHNKKGLTLTKEEQNGQTYHVIKSLDFPVEINYAFVNGYLIAVPNKALIERAIRFRDSGYVITSAPRFIASLPEDKQANFSALLYQNISSVVAPLAKTASRITGKLDNPELKALSGLASEAPSLAYAYSFGDRITLSVHTEKGALNLGDLLGMPGSMAMHSIIHDTLKK